MTNEKAIKEFIQSKLMLGKQDAGLADTDRLIERRIIDSLGILRLITHLETTFQVKIEDSDLVAENFETIRAISALISKKQSGAGSFKTA